MTTRPPSVAALLTSYLAGASECREPFSWRTSNCCHFGARWWRAVHGWDPMADLPETPTELAARRLIAELGGDLVSVWTRLLGQEPVAPALAQTGDLVVLPVPGSEGRRQTTGVCAGTSAWCLAEDGSLALAAASSAVAAWRIRP